MMGISKLLKIIDKDDDIFLYYTILMLFITVVVIQFLISLFSFDSNFERVKTGRSRQSKTKSGRGRKKEDGIIPEDFEE